MSVLLIVSAYGPPPALFDAALAEGRVRAVREAALTAADFNTASGLITTMHLDQDGFLHWQRPVAALLARGGRFFYNGHLLRPFLPGLAIFQPLPQPKRADFALTRLAPHGLFAGIDPATQLVTRKGVAGFYGRGHVPLPEGGVAMTGLGPQALPIDWLWSVPGGGQLFLHAGNDIWGGADAPELNRLLAERVVAWAEGALP